MGGSRGGVAPGPRSPCARGGCTLPTPHSALWRVPLSTEACEALSNTRTLPVGIERAGFSVRSLVKTCLEHMVSAGSQDLEPGLGTIGHCDKDPRIWPSAFSLIPEYSKGRV